MSRPFNWKDFDIIILMILVLIGLAIFSIISAIIMPVIHDWSEPKGAISFAYENMNDKVNVTFISKYIIPISRDSMISYKVIDSDNKWYDVVWSNVYNEIELNKSYDIRYVNGGFSRLWEIKPNTTPTILFMPNNVIRSILVCNERYDGDSEVCNFNNENYTIQNYSNIYSGGGGPGVYIMGKGFEKTPDLSVGMKRNPLEI